MSTLTNASTPLKLFGAVLALTLIVAAAFAVTMTGGAQAQNADNTYDDPQPCGPAAGTAFMPEPHEVTTGHFALFDAYWENTPGASNDDDNAGVLHTNLCPPLVTTTTETDRSGNTTTVTTLSASGLDVDEAIIHVLDTHETTAVADAAGDPNGDKLRLDQYSKVGEYIEAGDRVWWLRLEDPNLEGDQTSDLALGFSTMRFDGQYWGEAPDGGLPFRYKFELQRNPGIDVDDHPHFLTYRARESGQAEAELVWDTANPDDDGHDVHMAAGQLEDLQWIFTQPGTYELSVHLLGYVQQSPPDGADPYWRSISENGTIAETSEVKRYVIQVGSELAEVEPPQFGINYSILENSPAPTPLGAPIPIFRTELADLTYQISGEGSDDFALVSTSNPNTVQVVVADGAQLDFETRARYDLALSVTDNLDHESNRDHTIDDTLALGITLEDVPSSAVLKASTHNPGLGEGVIFTGTAKEFGAGRIIYHFWGGSDGAVSSTTTNTYGSHSSVPATQTIHFSVEYLPPGGDPTRDTSITEAEPITITWR